LQRPRIYTVSVAATNSYQQIVIDRLRSRCEAPAENSKTKKNDVEGQMCHGSVNFTYYY